MAECFASKSLCDMKQFANIGKILLSECFGDLLWCVCMAMCPMYCLLRLADMRIGGVDKVKYDMHEIDHLLPESVGRVRAVQL